MKEQILHNSTESFSAYVYSGGLVVVPSSATVTISRPSGGDILLTDAVMTVATDGKLSLSLSSGHNSVLGENYKAVITYVYSGGTDKAVRFYDVVRSRLDSVITDSDVTSELPQLKGSGWKVMGKAESGSVTTIIDSELSNYSDDYFTGGTAYSVDKDELRKITSFDSATGTVTVEAFSSAVVNDSYILTRSYGAEIVRAFDKLSEKISSMGKRPYLVLDPYDLKEIHLLMSVSEACKGLSLEEEGFYWKMWKEYESRADKLFASLNFKYDYSGDGEISRGESERANLSGRLKRR